MDPPAFNVTPVDVSSGDECSYKSDGSDGEEVKGSFLLMGTLMVIAASFISCFGLNLQKMSHNRNEERQLDERRPMHKSLLWVLGMICMVMGSVLDMVALPFVPLSRVSALGASGMIANILITPLFLGEKITKHDIFGGMITIIGTTIACVFGASTEPKLTSYCLLENFTEKLFVVYGICLFLFLCILYYHILAFRRRQALMVEAGQVTEFMECVWAWANLNIVMDPPEDANFKFITRLGPQFYPVVHAVFAGTFGAQSVMFAKAVLIFFRNAVDGVEVGKSVLMLFVFLIPTAMCLWFQIRYLNMSLQIYRDALFVLPVYQSIWISAGILSGLIFYREYKAIDGYHIGLFALGVVVVLIGLIVLTRRSSKTPEIQSPLGVNKAAGSGFDDTVSDSGTVKRGRANDLRNVSFSLAESFSLVQDYKNHLNHPEHSHLEDSPLMNKKIVDPYDGTVLSE